ncbi:MAG: EamA family transporter [Actinomycetota bacterium]
MPTRSASLFRPGSIDLDHRHRGWVLAALGMLLVSTDSLFIRLAETSAWNVAFIVSASAVPIMAILAWQYDDRATREGIRRHVRPVLLIGGLAGLSQIAFIGAVTRTAVANVVTIVASAPILAALVGWLVFGERTTARVWRAIGVTVVGVAIVVAGSFGSPTLDGDLLALLAIAAFGISINVWRRFPEMSVFVGLGASALVMLVVSSFFVDFATIDRRALLASLAMGMIFNPLGRVCHASAPRYAPASEVALFTPVETVAAPIWALLAFGERPPGQTVVGAMVIIVGVLYGTVLPLDRTGRTGRG